MTIKKVSIEEGCISCSLCEDIAPDVFLVEDGEDCQVRPCAEDHFTSKKDDIVLASEDCPVDVIRVEMAGPEAKTSDSEDAGTGHGAD